MWADQQPSEHSKDAPRVALWWRNFGESDIIRTRSFAPCSVPCGHPSDWHFASAMVSPMGCSSMVALSHR